MNRTYDIDRVKYGLPAGPDDPVYTAELWPLTKASVHFKSALRAFGPQIADLFAAGAGDPGARGLGGLAAGGYVASLVEQAADFDLLASFKLMASDASLKRVSAKSGMAFVYQDTDAGRVMATNDLQNGLEHYYAGGLDVVARLWWAMLCENSAPFASLHGWIAGVLQRRKPAVSPQP